ncbi:MAG TPA: thioredoxin domain-containing protein [Bryobacteraceae bacterium]|jgi:protein-disulfide isomerase|nr:thioredoxin domain-containing protein [Bryobacteraceae bacterium]
MRMSPGDLSRLLLPINPEDHVFGPESAEVTLVEYGDYECPECGRLFGVIHRLQETSPDRLRIAFRHYPLSGIHPHAQQAAEAAEAAGAQGKFWQMHDLLFQHQDHLQRKDLVSYAEQLGLDVKLLQSDLKKDVYAERVREDFRRGVQNGVYGTPGLFVNGVRHSGPYDAESLFAAAAV